MPWTQGSGSDSTWEWTGTEEEKTMAFEPSYSDFDLSLTDDPNDTTFDPDKFNLGQESYDQSEDLNLISDLDFDVGYWEDHGYTVDSGYNTPGGTTASGGSFDFAKLATSVGTTAAGLIKALVDQGQTPAVAAKTVAVQYPDIVVPDKGVPTWAWVAGGVGGVAILGIVLFLALRK